MFGVALLYYHARAADRLGERGLWTPCSGLILGAMPLVAALRCGFITLLLGYCCATNAQKQGNVWYLGIQAGIDLNGTSPVALLDGQTYTPLPNLWNEGTSSICDSTGMLLFYSNGEKIWNRQQLVMQGGDGLLGHASSTHAALIVPRPGSDRFFHIFTTDASENDFVNGLRCSVVDMCLDNGYGGVVLSEKNVLLAPGMAEKLAAVRHANGMDYWILAHGFNTNSFRAYRLTTIGIVDTVVTNIGPTDALGWGGQMVISSDGTQLAYAYPSTWGSLNLFDFDTATGVVSNARTHQNQVDDQSYGVGFSPDGTKLYVTTTNWGRVFQYDLTLGSWAATVAGRTQIAAENPDSWRDVKLGPDEKVYITRAQRYYLARIEQPNVAGSGCQYIDEAVYLGGRQASFGLPSHVAGYDYSNTVKDCSSAVGMPDMATNNLAVRYVGDGYLIIDFGEYNLFDLVIYDATGKACQRATRRGHGPTKIHLTSLLNGAYHLIAIRDSEIIRVSFVVSDRQ